MDGGPGGPRRTRPRWPAAVALAVLLLAAGWLGAPPNGLTARYFGNTTWAGAPARSAVERGISTAAFLQQADTHFRGAPFSAEWTGYLLIERPGEYTFATTSDDGSSLRLDGRTVVDNSGVHPVRTVAATVVLEPGTYALAVDYFDAGGDRTLAVTLAEGARPPAELPLRLLFPTRTAYLVRHLGYGYALPLACSVMLLGGVAGWGARHLTRHLKRHAHERWTNAALLATLALSLSVALPGIEWGLPHAVSWAVDEIPPEDVVEGLRQRFSGGWHRPYPPLQYMLLAPLVLPFEVAQQAGLGTVTGGLTSLTIVLLMRFVSTLMALGTVYLVYRGATELGGSRAAGLFGALLAGSLPLFVYYAKLANLDVPYVFWSTLALVCYIRFVKRGGLADAAWFAGAAVLAVCTKDQAYAFFVLPALHVVWLRLRTVRSVTALGRDRVLLATGAAALAALVAGQNLVFNFSGFLAHLRYIVTTATYAPVHPPSLAGYAAMAGETIDQIAWSMEWPALAAGVAGLAVLAVRSPRLALALSLVVVSYSLFFLGAIRYQFDRFHLLTCLMLAMTGGVALAELTGPGRLRLARGAVAGGLVAASVSYGSFVSAAMVADSRYHVEDWLRRHASAGDVIAYVGRRTYLPRMPYGSMRVPEAWDYVVGRRPDVLVVNAAYMCRGEPGTRRGDFNERLDDPGNGRYVLALAHRAEPAWPLRGRDSVFRAPCENEATNLSKINPEIRVYRRTDGQSAAPPSGGLD